VEAQQAWEHHVKMRKMKQVPMGQLKGEGAS